MSTTMEALACSNELPNFLVYDTISASPHAIHYLDHSQPTTAFGGGGGDHDGFVDRYASALLGSLAAPPESGGGGSSSCKQAAVPSSSGRKKRRRRPRSCKNKEEAESQRMTHIAVERNRRRQMNEHLAVLRSLMPESYIQRGDQASIVGGAIDFVKELEQLLQSLEVQQRTLQHNSNDINNETTTADGNSPPFAQFFSYPQYMWCHAPREYTPENHRAASAAVADIEVTLIETHANLRILSRKRPGQLLKMVAGFQALQLSILHLNVTTLDLMVLYSFSAKVEEGCNLTTVDDIAAAVHHMLSLIETEATAAAAAL